MPRRRAAAARSRHFGAPPRRAASPGAPGLQNRCGGLAAARRAGTPAMLVTICRPQRAQANPVGGSPNRYGASGPGRCCRRFPAPPAAAPRSSSSSPLRHAGRPPASASRRRRGQRGRTIAGHPGPKRHATLDRRGTAGGDVCGHDWFSCPQLPGVGDSVACSRAARRPRPGGGAGDGARPRRGSPLVMRDASASARRRRRRRARWADRGVIRRTGIAAAAGPGQGVMAAARVPSRRAGRLGASRDSPDSSIRSALPSSLSRAASAMVGSPRWSCHCAGGSWLVMMVERLP